MKKETFEVTFCTKRQEFEIEVEAVSMGNALRLATRKLESSGVVDFEVMQITRAKLYDFEFTIGRVAQF